MRPRPTGTLFALDHLAACRQILAAASRCPGSGTPVADRDLVVNSTVLCPTCEQAIPVEWVDQTRRVADHKRPEVDL